MLHFTDVSDKSGYSFRSDITDLAPFSIHSGENQGGGGGCA